jgi:glucosamine-6-phosphate deaminase
VTQGLGTILQADHLLVIASGSAKARAVGGVLRGPVTTTLPASMLRTHSHVTLILDPEAAAAWHRTALRA